MWRAAALAVVLAALAAIALGGEPAGGAGQAQNRSAAGGVLLGITGSKSRFQAQTGQDSLVDQAFLGWGQGQTFGASFPILFQQFGPIPLLTLGTNRAGAEAITPGAIASGQGDSYLIALNKAIGIWGKGIYVRPMAEMNNSAQLLVGVRCERRAEGCGAFDGGLPPGLRPDLDHPARRDRELGRREAQTARAVAADEWDPADREPLPAPADRLQPARQQQPAGCRERRLGVLPGCQVRRRRGR